MKLTFTDVGFTKEQLKKLLLAEPKLYLSGVLLICIVNIYIYIYIFIMPPGQKKHLQTVHRQTNPNPKKKLKQISAVHRNNQPQ